MDGVRPGFEEMGSACGVFHRQALERREQPRVVRVQECLHPCFVATDQRRLLEAEHGDDGWSRGRQRRHFSRAPVVEDPFSALAFG